MPAARVEELEQKLGEYVEANAAAQKRDADQRSEIKRLKAELKAVLWVKANWKMLGAAAAAMLVVVAAWWAYDRYLSRSEAEMPG